MNKLQLFIEKNSLSGPGRERLLKRSDAAKFVELCEEENVKLGGFDGFYLRPDGVQIEQSLSPDYSKNTKEESWELALDFFAKQKDENVGYEMAYQKK